MSIPTFEPIFPEEESPPIKVKNAAASGPGFRKQRRIKNPSVKLFRGS